MDAESGSCATVARISHARATIARITRITGCGEDDDQSGRLEAVRGPLRAREVAEIWITSALLRRHTRDPISRHSPPAAGREHPGGGPRTIVFSVIVLVNVFARRLRSSAVASFIRIYAPPTILLTAPLRPRMCVQEPILDQLCVRWARFSSWALCQHGCGGPERPPQPRRLPDLVGALKSTPGCVAWRWRAPGGQAGQSPWFEDKKACAEWFTATTTRRHEAVLQQSGGAERKPRKESETADR